MVDSQTPDPPAKFCESQILRRSQVSLPQIDSARFKRWNESYDIFSAVSYRLKEDEVQGASRCLTFSEMQESHLMQILDGLYIAAVDREDDILALRTFDNDQFTHVMQIAYRPTVSDDQPGWFNWKMEECLNYGPVHRLDLFCPTIYRYLSPDQTAIDTRQVHVAREFLSLALPYKSYEWSPEELHSDLGTKREEPAPCDSGSSHLPIPRYQPAKKADVLIAAPADRAVDVWVILLSYLSFLRDSDLDGMDMSDCPDELWDNARVAMGRLCRQYVEMVTEDECSSRSDR